MEPLKILLVLGICFWSCNAIVNLTWTAEKDILKLKCKTKSLIWSIQFLSPAGKEIGFCQIPIPSPRCHTSDGSYITVNQNTATNTTIITYKGIGSSLNGQWKCIYGRKIDVGTVNVTIPVQDTSMDDQNHENCFEEFYAWTMIGCTSSIVSILLVYAHLTMRGELSGDSCTKDMLIINCIEDESKFDICLKKKGKFACRIINIFVVICFVVAFPVCVGLISKDCKYKELFIIYGIFKAILLLIFCKNLATSMECNRLKKALAKEQEKETKKQEISKNALAKEQETAALAKEQETAALAKEQEKETKKQEISKNEMKQKRLKNEMEQKRLKNAKEQERLKKETGEKITEKKKCEDQSNLKAIGGNENEQKNSMDHSNLKGAQSDDQQSIHEAGNVKEGNEANNDGNKTEAEFEKAKKKKAEESMEMKSIGKQQNSSEVETNENSEPGETDRFL